jgi:ribosomal protein S18
MNYWLKDKKNLNLSKKRANWNQSLSSLKFSKVEPKRKRTLQSLLILKKSDSIIDYKNIKLLKAFLNKYGKIKSRRKTKVSIQEQRRLSKAIRKARYYGLFPVRVSIMSAKKNYEKSKIE